MRTYDAYEHVLDRIAVALERIADTIDKPYEEIGADYASAPDRCEHVWRDVPINPMDANSPSVAQCRRCGYRQDLGRVTFAVYEHPPNECPQHRWVLNFDGVTECDLCGYRISTSPTSENETDEQPGVSTE